MEGGANADAEIDEVERWLTAHVAAEPYLQSSVGQSLSARALQRGDLAAASSGYLEAGRLDPYNAVAAFCEATFLALLARDRERAEMSLEALRATGSHAALARLGAGVGAAGIAALDGQADAARAGLLDAYAGFRDLGAARKQAITALVMATLLDSGDAQARAAIAESRQLLERMGAGLWLARLDAAETGNAVAPKTRSATPQPAVPAGPRMTAAEAGPAVPSIRPTDLTECGGCATKLGRDARV